VTHSGNRPVAIGLRLYRALARAFPYEFRNAWGDELLETAGDAIEPVWRRHGVLGLARLLADIAVRVPAEHLAEFRQDVRHSLRVLAHSPGFTAVALLSLSLGIGIATSAFSEMNGFVLRDVPAVARPDQLVTLRAPVSYPAYERFRAHPGLFSSILAYMAPVPFGVSVGGRTERIWGHLVSASYFETLGVRPALGRFFESTADRGIIISDRLWRNRFGADPAIVGRQLRINGHPCTILGVGPKDFLGASPMVYAADVWMPLWSDPDAAPELAGHPLERRNLQAFHVVARLNPGVGEERAAAELDTVARQLEQAYGEEDRTLKGRRVRLAPGGKLLPIDKKDLPFFAGFFILLGGMVLAIACSNLANMTLARATGRRKEIAVRLALGAGRARLIRQLLTESMLVAAGAGVLGFAFAVWLMGLASREKLIFPMPIEFHLQPDFRVLLFTLALTLFTGLAFGLVPAFDATRTDLTPALKEGGAVRVSRYRRLSARNLLVISQVAGSLTLLLITGFLVIGHRRIANVSAGFDPRNLYLVSLDPMHEGYSGAQAAAFFPELQHRVQRLPGIAGAALMDRAPMSMIGHPLVTLSVSGAGQAGPSEVHYAQKHLVGREYFETAGIPILFGRGFRKEDETADTRVAIVSEKLVTDVWKGADPLGRRIEVGADEVPRFMFGGSGRFGSIGKAGVFEIVGVAANVREGLDFDPKNEPALIYIPLGPADYSRPALNGLTLMVRSAPGVDALRAVRREIASMDANLTPFNARGMTEQIDQLMFPVWVALWTYGCIGISGLILASIGVAGVTAYSVARRGREIGIRVALGARNGDVLGLVMKESAALVLVGSAAGIAGAWAGMRLLSSALSMVARAAGSSASDPMLLAGAPALLAALALLASYLPARRSLRIDPVAALRQE
jgi:predicted permease